MFDGFGPGQLAVVLLIILIVFGGSKIPEIMRGLGSGIRQMKKAMHDIQSEDDPLQDDPTSSRKP
jgi:sec-independent protein translocase protein TatA